MSFRPLAGLRVLDLSRLLPGPFLTQLLADLGADVVKVEEPGVGDYARWIPPEVDGAGYAFSAVNRGKRSMALDLKAEGARDVVLRLAARSDVFVESFRPGVLDRLGLDDGALAAANPRLVRVALVGYGPGPLRDAPGHDVNYQSLAGILGMQGPPERPMIGGAQIADISGALYGAVGVLAALHERERTGNGRRIEVALSDAALAFNAMHLTRARGPDALPPRGAWELTGGIPCYRLYRCRDGRFVALGTLEDKFWRRFCEAVGKPAWEEEQLSREADFHAEVEALFATRDADAWVAELAPAGVPITPVLSPAEALAHDAARRFGERVGPASPLTSEGATRDVPKLGADTEAILTDAGFSADEIGALRNAGALGES